MSLSTAQKEFRRKAMLVDDTFDLLVEVKQALKDDPIKAKGIWGKSVIAKIESWEKFIFRNRKTQES